MSSTTSSTKPFYKNPKIIIPALIIAVLAGLFIWKMTKEKSPSTPTNDTNNSQTQNMIQSMTDSDQSWNPDKDIENLNEAELSDLLKQEMTKISGSNLSTEQSKAIEEKSKILDDFAKGKRNSERAEFLFFFVALRCKIIYEDLKKILNKNNLYLSDCVVDSTGVTGSSTTGASGSSTTGASGSSTTGASGNASESAATPESAPASHKIADPLGKLIECAMTKLIDNEDAFVACSILALRFIQLLKGSSMRSLIEFKDNKIIVKGEVKVNWINLNKSIEQNEQIVDLEQKLNKPLTVQEFSTIVLNIGKIANKKSKLKDCRLCTIPDLE